MTISSTSSKSKNLKIIVLGTILVLVSAVTLVLYFMYGYGGKKPGNDDSKQTDSSNVGTGSKDSKSNTATFVKSIDLPNSKLGDLVGNVKPSEKNSIWFSYQDASSNEKTNNVSISKVANLLDGSYFDSETYKDLVKTLKNMFNSSSNMLFSMSFDQILSDLKSKEDENQQPKSSDKGNASDDEFIIKNKGKFLAIAFLRYATGVSVSKDEVLRLEDIKCIVKDSVQYKGYLKNLKFDDTQKLLIQPNSENLPIAVLIYKNEINNDFYKEALALYSCLMEFDNLALSYIKSTFDARANEIKNYIDDLKSIKSQDIDYTKVKYVHQTTNSDEKTTVEEGNITPEQPSNIIDKELDQSEVFTLINILLKTVEQGFKNTIENKFELNNESSNQQTVESSIEKLKNTIQKDKTYVSKMVIGYNFMQNLGSYAQEITKEENIKNESNVVKAGNNKTFEKTLRNLYEIAINKNTKNVIDVKTLFCEIIKIEEVLKSVDMFTKDFVDNNGKDMITLFAKTWSRAYFSSYMSSQDIEALSAPKQRTDSWYSYLNPFRRSSNYDEAQLEATILESNGAELNMTHLNRIFKELKYTQLSSRIIDILKEIKNDQKPTENNGDGDKPLTNETEIGVAAP